MYPYFRVITTLLGSRLRPNLQVGETGILKLRAGIFDIDTFGEVNNGRQLTLMDLGRYDMAVRTGLMKAGVSSKGGLIPATDVLKKFPKSNWNTELPIWGRAWIDADSQRPWPAKKTDK